MRRRGASPAVAAGAAVALVAAGLVATAAPAQQGPNPYGTLLQSGYVAVHSSFENGSFYLIMHPPAGSPTRRQYLCVIESRHRAAGSGNPPDFAPVSMCKEF